MTANPLIGTWRLVSYTLHDGDGRVSYPYGADPAGYLLYSADGFMTGGDQVRFLTLAGPRLTLRTPPFPIDGRPQTAVVVWERA